MATGEQGNTSTAITMIKNPSIDFYLFWLLLSVALYKYTPSCKGVY